MSFGPPSRATTNDARKQTRRLLRHATPAVAGIYQPWYATDLRKRAEQAQPLRRREAFLSACAHARRKVHLRQALAQRAPKRKPIAAGQQHAVADAAKGTHYEVGRNSYVNGTLSAGGAIVYYRPPRARRPWKVQAERAHARAAQWASRQRERAQRQRLLADRAAAWHTPALGQSCADDIGNFLVGRADTPHAAPPDNASPSTATERPTPRPQLALTEDGGGLGGEGSYLEGYLRSPTHLQAAQQEQQGDPQEEG